MTRTILVEEPRLLKIVGDLGIVRSVEKNVDIDGKPYGPAIVWYDVCSDRGHGDILDSFKRERFAWSYAMDLSRRLNNEN